MCHLPPFRWLRSFVLFLLETLKRNNTGTLSLLRIPPSLPEDQTQYQKSTALPSQSQSIFQIPIPDQRLPSLGSSSSLFPRLESVSNTEVANIKNIQPEVGFQTHGTTVGDCACGFYCGPVHPTIPLLQTRIEQETKRRKEISFVNRTGVRQDATPIHSFNVGQESWGRQNWEEPQIGLDSQLPGAVASWPRECDQHPSASALPYLTLPHFLAV